MHELHIDTTSAEDTEAGEMLLARIVGGAAPRKEPVLCCMEIDGVIYCEMH